MCSILSLCYMPLPVQHPIRCALMVLWTRSQRTFEFTRILMNDMRKNGMWDDVKAMLQAQVRWSDPRVKHENVSINIHAILVTMEKVKKFIATDDWKTVVLELVKLCFPRAVKGQDQPYVFDSGSEEKIGLLLTPMGQSLTYSARQVQRANKPQPKAKQQPKKSRASKPVVAPMPGETLAAAGMVGDSAEGGRREITWIEDVLAMIESVLAPLSPSQVQQAAKRETISMALQFMGVDVLMCGSQETVTHTSNNQPSLAFIVFLRGCALVWFRGLSWPWKTFTTWLCVCFGRLPLCSYMGVHASTGFSDLGHQASASKRNVCNTLQEAKRWSKVRHHLKTELFAKHKPFYKVVLASDQEPSAAAATASSDASGVVGPEKLVELAQVAEDSLLDAENGKALSDFLVKNTSKRPDNF